MALFPIPMNTMIKSVLLTLIRRLESSCRVAASRYTKLATRRDLITWDGSFHGFYPVHRLVVLPLFRDKFNNKVSF
jgi:hypothetical protein